MLRSIISAFLCALPVGLLCAAWVSLQNWALYSEDEVLDANVLHSLFDTGLHFAEPYWKPSMQQRERLDAIKIAIHWVAQALDKVGLKVFLESSSLIGWLRHGGHIPWETDADLGMVADDCRQANVSKDTVTRAAASISDDLVVLKFACACEEECEGEDKRLAGRFAHRQTGVTVDIFAYAPVKRPRPWQSASKYEGIEWWERVDDDHADYNFPRDTLLPLQEGEFLDSPMLLPHDPREFLSWEYGGCLNAHVWPWKLLLYSPWTNIVSAAVVLKSLSLMIGSDSRKAFVAASASVLYAAVAFAACGGGGVSLVLVLLANLCELVASTVQHESRLGFHRRRHQLCSLALIGAILFALRGSIQQLGCSLDDFYIRPRRPKTSTICLFGKCWDF